MEHAWAEAWRDKVPTTCHTYFMKHSCNMLGFRTFSSYVHVSYTLLTVCGTCMFTLEQWMYLTHARWVRVGGGWMWLLCNSSENKHIGTFRSCPSVTQLHNIEPCILQDISCTCQTCGYCLKYASHINIFNPAPCTAMHQAYSPNMHSTFIKHSCTMHLWTFC